MVAYTNRLFSHYKFRMKSDPPPFTIQYKGTWAIDPDMGFKKIKIWCLSFEFY